jgi:hypothetical protein
MNKISSLRKRKAIENLDMKVPHVKGQSDVPRVLGGQEKLNEVEERFSKDLSMTT